MPIDSVSNVIIPFLRGHGLSETPNMRVPKESRQFSSYDECIVVACAALRKYNPDMSIQLATDVPVQGPLGELLEALAVECVVIPFSRTVPPGFADKFFATLYYLDVIAKLPLKGALLLDPDVLCTRPLKDLCGPSSGNVMVFRIAYPPEYKINGLSREQAAHIHNALDGSTGLPAHFGGEFYYIPGGCAQQVSERLEEAWHDALLRFERGLPHFVTEEHFLSYALRPFETCGTDYEIKRIWTTLRQRNVSGEEGLYTLWHLPSEKGRGFHALFEDAIDSTSWFWVDSEKEFIYKAGVVMGLHKRNPMRFMVETFVGSIYRTADKVRGIQRLP